MRRFGKKSRIRTAVIGYGPAFNMGRHHLMEMKSVGMTPAAVCELDAQRLEVAESDFPGIETYSSVRDMLSKSDVHLITVITPHHTHARLALQCLRAGRHVVCEKPMAITTAQCDRMIDTARKNKVLVTAYHNRHWDGCVMQAVKTIRRGVIGDVHRVAAHLGGYGNPGDWWRSSKSISGGIMYDWGVHFLEYSLQILDSDVLEVTGFAHQGFWAKQTAWKQDTNEDEATAVVRFKSGASLTLTVSSLDVSPPPHWFKISGTRGAYIFDSGTWQVTTRTADRTCTEQGTNPPSQWRRFYANLAEHLTSGKKLVITPQWSRRPIHILDLAGRSAKQGRTLVARYH